MYHPAAVPRAGQDRLYELFVLYIIALGVASMQYCWIFTAINLYVPSFRMCCRSSVVFNDISRERQNNKTRRGDELEHEAKKKAKCVYR